jgi:hypothetical protein
VRLAVAVVAAVALELEDLAATAAPLVARPGGTVVVARPGGLVPERAAVEAAQPGTPVVAAAAGPGGLLAAPTDPVVVAAAAAAAAAPVGLVIEVAAVAALEY